MIIDKKLMFFDNEHVGKNSVSVIDLKRGGDAVGEELTLYVIATGFLGQVSNDKLTFELETASIANKDETDILANDKVTLVKSGEIVGPFTRGKTLFKVRVPQGAKRYLALRVTGTGGEKVATLRISAFLTSEL